MRIMDGYDSFNESFASIRKGSNLESLLNDEAASFSVFSIDDAIFQIKLKPLLRRWILYNVIIYDVPGNAESYHSLIELCRNHRDYTAAYGLCEYAISKFENSLTLYTDLIEISTEFENPAQYCSSYMEKVLHSERKLWKLRLFLAVYKYYYKLIDINLGKGIQIDYYEKAKASATGMQNLFYGKEDGYYAEAKLLLLVGKREEARAHLEEWIFCPLDAEKDSIRDLQCPKCCHLWITEFREFSGDCQKEEYVIDKGLLDSDGDDERDFFLAQKERLIKRLSLLNREPYYDNMLEKDKHHYIRNTYITNPNINEKE